MFYDDSLFTIRKGRCENAAEVVAGVKTTPCPPFIPKDAFDRFITNSIDEFDKDFEKPVYYVESLGIYTLYTKIVYYAGCKMYEITINLYWVA